MKPTPKTIKELRVLKTEADYETALNELEVLVLKDPQVDTAKGDRLELLTVLVREYETRNYRFDAVDAIDAIELKMEEQGLRQKDLAPLLGGRNRVSEILSRKRPLTLDMIRALHGVLNIPLHILIVPEKAKRAGEVDTANADDKFEWSKFPISEMRKRGWFDGMATTRRDDAETLVKQFLAKVSNRVETVPALFRRTFRGLTPGVASRHSLIAWTAQVLIHAKTLEVGTPPFSADKLDDIFFKDVARLSSFEKGPRLAADLLRDYGIILVVEPALPATLVDGAALMAESGRAVIGMTLRHDRIDNFWFTLLHELAHVRHHLNRPSEGFVDRTDDDASSDPLEHEANKNAREALIPRSYWRSSVVSATPTKKAIIAFAKELGVHPAVVAGRIRFETKQFDRFTEMLGHGEVRRLFRVA
jgi:HTH-type transcriptional regulator / antitoxin HigA